MKGLCDLQAGIYVFGGWVFGELVESAGIDTCFLQGIDSSLEDACGEYTWIADDEGSGGPEAFS